MARQGLRSEELFSSVRTSKSYRNDLCCFVSNLHAADLVQAEIYPFAVAASDIFRVRTLLASTSSRCRRLTAAPLPRKWCACGSDDRPGTARDSVRDDR